MNTPFKMTERDLDLMLLEELCSDTEFAIWFASQIGIAGAKFNTAEHSVSAKANAKWGETDVLAFFTTGMETTAVLIEDKIAAQFADRQAERYQERAREMIASGVADKSVVVLCAPHSYLSGVPKDDPWDKKLSLEYLAEWFSAYNNFRGGWRSDALRACLARLSRNSSAGSEEVRRFSQSFKRYLNAQNEGLDHTVTGDKWGFIIKTSKTPAYVQLAWKNGKGRVDLTFWGSHIGKAAQITPPEGIKVTIGDGIRLKSDIFGVEVPVADLTAPVEDQPDVTREVMAAIRTLLPIVPMVLPDAR